MVRDKALILQLNIYLNEFLRALSNKACKHVIIEHSDTCIHRIHMCCRRVLEVLKFGKYLFNSDFVTGHSVTSVTGNVKNVTCHNCHNCHTCHTVTGRKKIYLFTCHNCHTCHTCHTATGRKKIYLFKNFSSHTCHICHKCD